MRLPRLLRRPRSTCPHEFEPLPTTSRVNVIHFVCVKCGALR